jgi:hypothetical protein
MSQEKTTQVTVFWSRHESPIRNRINEFYCFLVAARISHSESNQRVLLFFGRGTNLPFGIESTSSTVFWSREVAHSESNQRDLMFFGRGTNLPFGIESTSSTVFWSREMALDIEASSKTKMFSRVSRINYSIFLFRS